MCRATACIDQLDRTLLIVGLTWPSRTADPPDHVGDVIADEQALLGRVARDVP